MNETFADSEEQSLRRRPGGGGGGSSSSSGGSSSGGSSSGGSNTGGTLSGNITWSSETCPKSLGTRIALGSQLTIDAPSSAALSSVMTASPAAVPKTVVSSGSRTRYTFAITDAALWARQGRILFTLPTGYQDCYFEGVGTGWKRVDTSVWFPFQAGIHQETSVNLGVFSRTQGGLLLSGQLYPTAETVNAFQNGPAPTRQARFGGEGIWVYEGLAPGRYDIDVISSSNRDVYGSRLTHVSFEFQ